MWHSKIREEAGFTLLEAMLSIAIMGIVGGMAAASLGEARRVMQGDGAMRIVLSELNTARDMAMTQRRNMEVQFIGGTWVRTVRHEAPGIATTIVRNVALESNATFSQVSGVPDTPDAFGATAPVAFGAAQVIQFGTDGTLIDGNGNPVNGTVFLAIANQPLTVRAVTVLGATGRVRGYKWANGAWKRV